MESLLTKNTLLTSNIFIEKFNVFNYENMLLSNNKKEVKKNNLTANSKIKTFNINNISEFKINFSFNNNNYNNTNKPLSSLINRSNKQSNVFISVFNNNFEKESLGINTIHQSCLEISQKSFIFEDNSKLEESINQSHKSN